MTPQKNLVMREGDQESTRRCSPLIGSDPIRIMTVESREVRKEEEEEKKKGR